MKKNIETVKYILEHPEDWGSGTKESWEKALRELEGKLSLYQPKPKGEVNV